MGPEAIQAARHRRHREAGNKMRRYATTWLLLASIVIAESHSYVGEYGETHANWILTVDRTMPIKWNIKYLSDEINAIIYFVAMLLYIPNRVNKTTVITFIILCVIDLVMYFHNYKTLFYGSVYVWSAGIWMLVFSRLPLKRQIHLLWKKITHSLILTVQRLKRKKWIKRG